MSRFACTTRLESPHIGALALSAFIVILTTVGASTVSAQIVYGTLLDDETGQPISGATVALLTSDDETVRGVLTDPAGKFRIEAPSTGQYRLKTARIGYQTTISPPIDIDVEEALEVELRMATEAILLAPLTVISERMPQVLNARLERWGYYERKEIYGDEGMGFAQFIERDEIKRTIPFQISDVLRTIPGLKVRDENVTMRFGCTPAIFVDNTRYRFEMSRINDIISLSSVVAIEIYKGSVMPGRYMHLSESGGIPCGAIAVWTGI